MTDSNVPSFAFDLDGLTRASLRARAYASRIDELKAYARDDGYRLNSESEADFWAFIKLTPRFRKGGLLLMDNGNLRAVWKDGHGSHLGVQFLGDGMAQYVIFKRRGAKRRISRVVGRDSFDGVSRQIDAFDLSALLYE